MRTSDRLPEECREEIRAIVEELEVAKERGIDRYGHAPATCLAIETLKWVLGDDGK